MRMMLKVTVPTVEGNKALKDGSMGKFIEHTLSDLKPEAAYFTAEKGQRTAYLFVDIKDSSEMPHFGERFFLAFNAAVDFVPVMNADELKRGLPKALAGIG
ncbi:hypothetical protein [Mesorhizobium sp. M2C.T.Ca.TU.002.02.1.1]|jgi:hypothetical protein|uniref:hypothetical protein n=1 Tax=Mesorhizobium sp. M2C.T.Ca.TU.002.02.1.1 TaxID=2496788 RepID=UPI000FCC6E65|nr:hypothetical protein [Mesorhizobium sp. M2C.T.Ca.TU.002.02.1.1]RUU60652.1 hypothetical protein EOD07_03485 [Mesorhizobium sp. M2C.T.Ca.TU.002.02.1.1]RUU71300.1 hypothetical protein EOD04_03405 [Mesorhizobium sp. M2C.T.Ca.TU.009.01.2.1]